MVIYRRTHCTQCQPDSVAAAHSRYLLYTRHSVYCWSHHVCQLTLPLFFNFLHVFAKCRALTYLFLCRTNIVDVSSLAGNSFMAMASPGVSARIRAWLFLSLLMHFGAMIGVSCYKLQRFPFLFLNASQPPFGLWPTHLHRQITLGQAWRWCCNPCAFSWLRWFSCGVALEDLPNMTLFKIRYCKIQFNQRHFLLVTTSRKCVKRCSKNDPSSINSL